LLEIGAAVIARSSVTSVNLRSPWGSTTIGVADEQVFVAMCPTVAVVGDISHTNRVDEDVLSVPIVISIVGTVVQTIAAQTAIVTAVVVKAAVGAVVDVVG